MRYSIINVYAPCQGQDRQAFASHLQAILPTDGRTVLMGGDFNCIDTQYDAIPCPNPRSRRFVGATDFAIITTSATLTDTWRHLHPAPCLGFTHTDTSRDGASRLDRWYATHALLGCTTTTSFVDGLPGDHRGILFSFTPPGAIVCQRPPWRLPLWLLADREFMTSFRRGSTQLQANRLHAQDSTRSAHEFLQALAHPTAQNPSNHPQSQETPTPTDDDPAGLLEDLIACFRACAQRREGLDRAASRHERQRLEGEVNMALAQLDPSASHPQPSLIAHQRAHTALATHAQIASDTAAARAAAVARTFHESGTHHFHTTYGSHHHQDVLFHSVTDTTANTTFAIDTPAQLQRGKDIAASALTKLFGQRPVDHFAQDRLLSHLDTTITTEAATATGSPLTLSDMHNAARALQRNKSPGLDGIPVEAYLALWEVFGQVLTNAFNACHQASPCCLSPRQRTSDYTLIPKATTPSDPGSRRPIAGVNTDVRICARAITTRLATALQPVVDATQTGFLPGRWIGDNILAHTELSECLARNNAPGCMLFLDFSKAFDYVDRGWILRVMAALGFTAAGQHWAQQFLMDTLGRARVNGAPSCTFRVISGCPQGNPISPLLYILQSQPLLAHIRTRHLQNTSVVRPISLPTGISAPLSHQHADDTSIHAATIADCDTIVSQSLGLFSAASGAQLNATKTQTLCFGTSRPSSPQTSNITGIVYDLTTTHAKHLGIIVGRSATADAARSSQVNALLHSVRTTIHYWSNHRLPYFARCEVAKQ